MDIGIIPMFLLYKNIYDVGVKTINKFAPIPIVP